MSKPIELINLELSLEKEELNLMRKQQDLQFREREYDYKIREAEQIPVRLKEEKHNVTEKLSSEISNYQAIVKKIKKEIESYGSFDNKTTDQH